LELTLPSEYGKYYQLAVTRGFIQPEDTVIIFYDYSILKNRLEILKGLLSTNALHTVAIKANPLLHTLKFINKQGFGLEAASMGEVQLALAANCDPAKIVFDSPAKTEAEIQYIATHYPDVYLNANSIEELKIFSKFNLVQFGLRINPQISVDSVSYLNVSGDYSKFGVLVSNEKEIIEACLHQPGLTGLHVHSGSQYQNLKPTTEGIKKILDLTEKINSLHSGKIKIIDIGGGFPVNYHQDENPYEIEVFFEKLQQECPALFNGQYKIITEFGRYYHANAGWVLSDVAAVKNIDNTQVVTLQVSADMFVRECYNPNDWYHEIFVCNQNGALKTSTNPHATDITGPLCFGGDYITRNRSLPEIDTGDKVIIADSGANSFSLWSRHCSRNFPKVIAYSSKKDGEEMTVIKERETFEEILRFWG
jgi:diaminopimelate decarboxylase